MQVALTAIVHMSFPIILGVACAATCLGTSSALSPSWTLASSRGVTTSFLGSRSMLVRGGSTPEAADVCMRAGDNDLYIVGAGYLGTLIGQQWRAKFPSAAVYAETRSPGRHADLEKLGFKPTLRGARSEGLVQCRNVVFCAAPSGNDQYGEEVAAATADIWDSSSAAGTFVFTSSGGIYAESAGGIVTEESPVSDQPRSVKLKGAEAACLAAGGCVVRLAGLYSVERGPHNFWLGKDELDSSPDGLINLLAYEDAASAVVAALQAAKRGRIFLAADTVPTSRLHICEQALRHPFYAGKTVPRFPEGAPGAGATKVYDSTVTRKDLAWEPRYESFGEFMSSKAAEVEGD